MPRLRPHGFSVPILTAGLGWIDLEFLGRPHAIATAVVQSPGDVTLIDPGPSSCLPVLDRELLRGGVRLSDVTQVWLTHIHLDHAGSTGTLLERYPHIIVRVHERGAPHLQDPSKLLQSAARLYGEHMDRLWGTVRPVPAQNIRPLAGGEVVQGGGRSFEVAYTPGHASHHVSYFDPSSGVAFVGDTGGVSIDGGYILPPTPPPDIDVELWHASLERIEGWGPSTLFMTHFGPVVNVGPHLQRLRANLGTLAEMVRLSLLEDGTDEERQSRFLDRLRLELRREMTEAQALAYESASPLYLHWLGLARYWRKRSG
jgi:glyoxylase-like metal-dependent hydrolase (beta-lactamase superfamily II)